MACRIRKVRIYITEDHFLHSDRLYYQYDPSRVAACPLTIHALIHIANDTRNAGPLCRIWEFVTERAMGIIARSVKNKRLPFSQLAETVKLREQLKAVAIRFDMIDKLQIRRKRRNWSHVSSAETLLPNLSKSQWRIMTIAHECYFVGSTTVLMNPGEKDYKWTQHEKRLVAVYLKNSLGLTSSAPRIEKELPATVQRWGKIRVLGEKEIIRSKWSNSRLAQDRMRDASFVRVSVFSQV